MTYPRWEFRFRAHQGRADDADGYKLPGLAGTKESVAGLPEFEHVGFVAVRHCCRWRVGVVGLVRGLECRDLWRPAGVELLDDERSFPCRDDCPSECREVGWVSQAKAGAPRLADY
jgi:hypothetical protein